MREWGGRWGPDVASGKFSQFLTSQFIHLNFVHVFANTLLFIGVGIQIEIKYGSLRTMVLWLVSILGSNFLSAALEDRCTQVVGASGGVFGFVGLFIADMIINFETITRPILRSFCILVFLVFFVITIMVEEGTSHVSHLGGLLCGLFPAGLFLPNLRSERWEAILPVLGACVLLAIFVTCPIYIYSDRYRGLQCD
eukprot:TRINITY_DN12822_c0_g1_i1.p2 TRINITY_DN12822_c0_g1~~TRINITY_DN12822_c0_g1_i1.p2  ORF type:complete len:209 (-),score=9.52 TRINITY_DN12822_c0_g1_i1:239-826(-)